MSRLIRFPLRPALSVPDVHLRLHRALATAESSSTELAGTTPPHRSYVFLHTVHPPSSYPAKYATPIQRRLLSAIAPWGGTVNFAWSTSHPRESEGETQRLTAFSGRGKLEIEAVSLANVDDVAETLRTHAEPSSYADADADDTVHLYVCTHGARDCRCGETGGAVARTIRAELERRHTDPRNRVRWELAEVAHVGGHQFAGNLLVYPHGEWLGNVKPENVAGILDTILARPIRPLHAEEIPMCPSHWRGRMGLSKDEQMELFNRFSEQY